MDSVTITRLDNLFWMGRYIERVYQLISMYMDGYDKMIDVDDFCYMDICTALGIPNDYQSKEDFMERFAFDDTNCFSIISNSYRAYDNAMLIRDEISTKTLAYIHLAISEMERAKISSSPIYNLQQVLDHILAFWGCLDDEVDDEATRNTVKAGKRIERLDLYLRTKKPKSALEREMDRLTHRVDTTPLKYNKAAMKHVAAMIEDDPIDYEATLEKANSIFS